jgi:hypothetical protein
MVAKVTRYKLTFKRLSSAWQNSSVQNFMTIQSVFGRSWYVRTDGQTRARSHFDRPSALTRRHLNIIALYFGLSSQKYWWPCERSAWVYYAFSCSGLSSQKYWWPCKGSAWVFSNNFVIQSTKYHLFWIRTDRCIGLLKSSGMLSRCDTWRAKWNSVEITNMMQPCNRIYYSTVHWRLNMFRAAYRSLSGALTVISTESYCYARIHEY